MADEQNYVGLQQPSGGYGGDGGTGGYGNSQNPPPAYAGGPLATPSLVAGWGNGVNFQPSYYHGGNVDLGWAVIRAKPKIKSVRIEIEPGQEANAKRWISEAISNGYAVIATYHKYTVLGTSVASELQLAASWWATHYASLRASGAFTVNLMNEWGGHAISEQDFAAAYNQAIGTVRTVYSGSIIIDIPGYGQEAHTAALAVTGAATQRITDRKIILSAHIYPNAWNQRRRRGMTTDDIDELSATGLDCIVGEFGDDGASGNTPWRALVTYAKSKQWPVFGWAWNGDGGNMNMVTPQFQALVAGQTQQYSTTQYFNTIYSCL